MKFILHQKESVRRRWGQKKMSVPIYLMSVLFVGIVWCFWDTRRALVPFLEATMSLHQLPPHVSLVDGEDTRRILLQQRIAQQLTVSALQSDNGLPKPSLAYLSPTLIVTRGGVNTDLCFCEFISVDCLDSMDCLPITHMGNGASTLPSSKKAQISAEVVMAMGIYTRQTMKKMSKFQGKAAPMFAFPVGLSTQAASIQAWQIWTRELRLFERYDDVETLFLNSTQYPQHCGSASTSGSPLIGKNCFFAPLQEPEELEELEANAAAQQPVSTTLKTLIQEDVRAYQQRVSSDEDLPALGHFMTAAHVTRILFHRRPLTQQLFHNMTLTFGQETGTSTDSATLILRVSLHLRRADSCSNKQTYESQPSSLDSPSQPTTTRKCYTTSVYINALQRVQERFQKNHNDVNTRLHVYLSSDHSESLIEEIQSNFPAVYRTITWHVLGYDRKTFAYKGTVEGHRHNNHNILGESALADLWLLSHGQVFIGHLGSRFGKIGYLLATARYNHFVPFFSVDGHAYCCDIDEPCGHVKPYIRSMDNCLTFTHIRRHIPMNKDYWKIGTFTRKVAALQQEEKEYPLGEYFWQKGGN